MRFILQEALLNDVSDANTIPKIDTPKGTAPDWMKIFSTKHPIDETKINDDPLPYAGMSSTDLWNAFWSKDDFLLATGIETSTANPGELCRENMGTTLRDEMYSLGFNKSSNPFLKLIEDTYLKNTSTFSEFPNKYNALHNSYLKGYITWTDLASNTTDLGKLIRNPSLYRNYSAAEVLGLLGVLHRSVIDKKVTGTDFVEKFSGLNTTCILATIMVTGIYKDSVSDSPTNDLTTGNFLPWSVVSQSIKALFGETKARREVTRKDEVEEIIKTVFLNGYSGSLADIPANDTKRSDVCDAVLYLAYTSAVITNHSDAANNLIGEKYLQKYVPTYTADSLFKKGKWDSLAKSADQRLSADISLNALQKFCTSLTELTKTKP